MLSTRMVITSAFVLAFDNVFRLFAVVKPDNQNVAKERYNYDGDDVGHGWFLSD